MITADSALDITHDYRYIEKWLKARRWTNPQAGRDNQATMPRFEDEHITSLKRVMLPRLPECFFAPEDYPVVMAETGLNQAQIEQWARHLRFRLPVAQDREAFLRTTGAPEQVVIPCLE
jgi:hypothetical protein